MPASIAGVDYFLGFLLPQRFSAASFPISAFERDQRHRGRELEGWEDAVG